VHCRHRCSVRSQHSLQRAADDSDWWYCADMLRPSVFLAVLNRDGVGMWIHLTFQVASFSGHGRRHFLVRDLEDAAFVVDEHDSPTAFRAGPVTGSCAGAVVNAFGIADPASHIHRVVFVAGAQQDRRAKDCREQPSNSFYFSS